MSDIQTTYAKFRQNVTNTLLSHRWTISSNLDHPGAIHGWIAQKSVETRAGTQLLKIRFVPLWDCVGRLEVHIDTCGHGPSNNSLQSLSEIGFKVTKIMNSAEVASITSRFVSAIDVVLNDLFAKTAHPRSFNLGISNTHLLVAEPNLETALLAADL